MCECEGDLHRAELKITPLNQMNKQTSYILNTAFSHGCMNLSATESHFLEKKHTLLIWNIYSLRLLVNASFLYAGIFMNLIKPFFFSTKTNSIVSFVSFSQSIFSFFSEVPTDLTVFHIFHW